MPRTASPPSEMNSSKHIYLFTFKLLARTKLNEFHSPHAISCSMKTSTPKFSIKSGKRMVNRMMWPKYTTGGRMFCPWLFFSHSSFSLQKHQAMQKTIDIPCGRAMKIGPSTDSTRCMFLSVFNYFFFSLFSLFPVVCKRKLTSFRYFCSSNSTSLPP